MASINFINACDEIATESAQMNAITLYATMQIIANSDSSAKAITLTLKLTLPLTLTLTLTLL